MVESLEYNKLFIPLHSDKCNSKSSVIDVGILFIYVILKTLTRIDMAVVYMTEDGYKKLVEQVAHLESVERPSISRQIAEARDKGDLSENAEYDAAKEAQGLLEMKISQLKETLASARVIDESKLKTDSVQIMTKVKVKDQTSGREMEYTLVSESEANIREGKLAINTPIGKSLLGKKIGDTVEVTIPAGILKLEILNISL